MNDLRGPQVALATLWVSGTPPSKWCLRAAHRFSMKGAWQNDDILVPSPISTGSRSFLGSLVAPGLVGRFALIVAPVMLGTGLPLFCELTTPTSLTLVSSMAFPGAVVAQIYRPA